MKIEAYTSAHQTEWDALIRSSRNGTFLLERAYMDYHADRFEDASALFYDEKEHLLAVIPISIHRVEKIAYSHRGLTYGGLILSDKVTTVQVLEMMHLLQDKLKEQGVERFFYRPVPAIYHRYPTQEDLYALFRSGAVWCKSSVSTVIDLEHPLKMQTLRKRGAKKAKNAGLVLERVSDCCDFWPVLTDTLQTKYSAHPVHTLAEMQLLMQRFPEQIACYLMRQGEDVVGGCIVYETDKVAHLQYIASSAEGRHLGALDLLFYQLVTECYAHKRYFDFGTSVEEEGRYLNEGLIFQKEGFGGRAVVYNGYELKLK